MKQRIVTSITVLALLAVASTASAQGLNLKVGGEGSVNAGPSRLEVRASTTASTSARQIENEERKASSTARRVEMQQSIAKRMAVHAEKMLGAMIERLEKLADRIASRIEKVKAEGGVVAESERYLAEAKVHIEAAKTSLRAYASVELSSDKLRDNFLKLRAAASEVKAHLREAHRDLVSAIRNLKPGLRINTEATTNAGVSL